MKRLPDETPVVRRMMRCLALAQKGSGRVAPNPLVGCVIEREGRIVGEGYHRRFGGAHAEIEALRRAAGLAAGATLYVNLEPCNHIGKTPPCTDAILNAGIRSVVVGLRDPNREVKGGGIRRLRAAGLQVITGVCEGECAELNRVYVTNVTAQRPHVVLKIAQSVDGFIAQPDGRSKWITGEESRAAVRSMRNTFDAILVGAETVRRDNPSLLPADRKRAVPYRLILTAAGPLDPRSILFTDPFRERTRIVTTPAGAASLLRSHPWTRRAADQVVKTRAGRDGLVRIPEMLKTLHRSGICSILVEGGSRVFSQFLAADCADELWIFTAPKLLGQGIRAIEGLKAMSLRHARRFTIAETSLRGGDAVIRCLRIR